MFSTLRPYGGTAYPAIPKGTDPVSLDENQKSSLPQAKFTQTNRAVLVRRVGALPESAPWTHEFADAGVSYFSHDRCVRPPLAVLWYGDGPDHGFWMWHAYDTGLKPQVSGGRLFAWRSGVLTAYDVYTGRLLWTAKTDRVIATPRWKTASMLAGGNRASSSTRRRRSLRTHRFKVEPGGAADVVNIGVSQTT